MHLVKRLKAPTPKFFKKFRAIGLALASVGGVLLAAPVMLPPVIVSVGGYLTVVGGVISVMSQTVVDGESDKLFEENVDT